jgi:hypothetical protein
MRSAICCVLISAFVIPASELSAFNQTIQQTATTTVATPVFASPDSSQTPLRVAREGSVLLLIRILGDWCHVEFEDPEFGRRSGYVQTKSVRIEQAPADETPGRQQEPMRLSPPSSASRPVASQPAESSGPETTATGVRDGEILGDGIRTGGKVGVGVAIGVLTGLIGTGIGYFVIGPEQMTPEAFQRSSTRTIDYQTGFRSGWDKRTQSKKRKAFLAGGLLGTAAWIAIFISAQSGSQY